MRISDWSSDVCSSDLFLHGDRAALSRLVRDARTRNSQGLGRFSRVRPRDPVDQLWPLLAQPAAAPAQGARPHRADDRARRDPRRGRQCPAAGDARLGYLLRARLLRREPARHRLRSEEHTSELQSLMRISYAVFCLKKKKQTQNQNTYTVQHNKEKNTYEDK